MKISNIAIVTILSLAMITVPMQLNDSISNVSKTFAEEIVPYSSSVFSSYSGRVSTNICSASVGLVSMGNVTIRVILQKKNTFGNWSDYKTSDRGTTYSNVVNVTHSYSYPITVSGEYRCKYIINGAVNGTIKTLTGYSSVLTV